MGGGSVMAAAKVAGIGVAHGGFRQLAAAVRWAARPVLAIATSAEDGKLSGGAVLAAEKVEDSVQRPCWELACEPAPRLVFGGAPTAQEAKQATVELKDALVKTYLSPSFTGGQGSFLSGQESGMLHLSNSECMENKAVTDSLNLPVSKHVIQAFRLFSESPAAQTVVASIVSDPSVWNAVQQNHAFVEFFESHKTTDPSSPRLFDESCDTAKQSYGNWIRKILGNFRVSVVEMMGSFPGFFSNHEAEAKAKVEMMSSFPGFFSNHEAKAKAKAEAETDGTSKAEADGAFKAYLMGLVIMVIMLVVCKRV